MAEHRSRVPLIEVSGVDKSFGDKAALKGLSFTVYQGEIFGFLGPSGAGKTTTIKLLTRQLTPNAGDMRLFGQEIARLKRDVYDDIGVLTDNSGLYERLSIYDNLAVFADLKKLPHTAINDVLADVGLADEAKKQAKTLSRGMKQRLMLARATLHKPKLLFLDEPTAALDPGTSQHIHEMLRRLNREGTTIFLTTHNMEEADKLCDRVAFLNSGAVVACDTPEAHKLKHAKCLMVAKTAEGHMHEVEKSAAGLTKLVDLLEGETLLTLHSQEPNLEEVFLEMTGRGLS